MSKGSSSSATSVAADDPLEGHYPSLYTAVDRTSLAGQSLFLRSLRIRLAGLLVATLGGGILLATSGHVLGGWVSLAGFVAALGSELFSAVMRPEKSWYEGRAAAESAKTLAWRYVSRGDNFSGGSRASETDALFNRAIRDLLDDLSDIQLTVDENKGEQITARMRELRSQNFAARKAVYREGRLENQRRWYARKANANRVAAHRWTAAVIAAEVLGVFGGLATLTGAADLDLLGVLAGVAAAVTAWLQAKQHRNLAVAYGVTAQELSAVKSDLDALEDEADWPAFVGQAEEAISREHTLWRASRGVAIRRSRD